MQGMSQQNPELWGEGLDMPSDAMADTADQVRMVS